MKKAIFAMALVSILALGLGSQAESKDVSLVTCIVGMAHQLDAGGKASFRIVVRDGSRLRHFSVQSGRLRMAEYSEILTPAQLAAWRTMLEQFRAAAVAKVKVQFVYDDSSGWVTFFGIQFGTPC